MKKRHELRILWQSQSLVHTVYIAAHGFHLVPSGRGFLCGYAISDTSDDAEFLDIRKELISIYRDRTPCEDYLYGFYNGQFCVSLHVFCREYLLWLICYALFLLGML